MDSSLASSSLLELASPEQNRVQGSETWVVASWCYSVVSSPIACTVKHFSRSYFASIDEFLEVVYDVCMIEKIGVS